jgi:hypothetical protein
MRVKLCTRCPYTPRDLEGHFDPQATTHACARCDGEQDRIKMYYPREQHRRRKCSFAPRIFSIPQPSAAPLVAGSSVSSDTILADCSSVRRSASIASGTVGRATAGGCAIFEPLEMAAGGELTAIPSRSETRNKESAR